MPDHIPYSMRTRATRTDRQKPRFILPKSTAVLKMWSKANQFSRWSWILILACVCSPIIVTGAPRLILAQILFRHGMRAPEDAYPTDPFQDGSVYWPNGWGQLTDFGKEQQYQLGNYLRSRYASLLSPNYVPEELQVIASGYDRTVNSALLALAGLYPNTVRNQYEYSRLDWQPIPIRTYNSGSNKLMLHPSYLSKREVCPIYYDLLDKVDEHPTVKKAKAENRELIEHLKNKTGIGETKSWKHVTAGYIMGTVKIEKFHKLSIPQWADDVLTSPSNLRFFKEVFGYLSLTPEMKRLTAGPIMTEWIQNMRTRVDGNETAKLYVYSAHDLNLINVLGAMGLNDPPMLPEMGSTLFVELYEDSGNGSLKHTVRLSYRDGLSREVTSLQLPGCSEPCDLDEFERVLEPYLVEDLDKECGLASGDSGGGSLSVLESALIAVVVILSMLVLALDFYHRRIRNKSKTYAVEQLQQTTTSTK